jgi:hypothetical protein
MGVSGGPYIVRDSSLVLELDAADRNSYVSGSSIWFDNSGNNYTGSLINGPIFNSGSGGSIVFDGANDYSSNEYISQLYNTKTVTYNVWLKSNSLGGNKIIIGNENQNSTIGLGIRQRSDNSYWMSPGVGLTNIIRVVPNVDITKIHMITALTDGTNGSFYINGSFISSSAYSTTYTSQTTFYVGAGNAVSGPGNEAYAGNIYNIQIYNRALSPQEILQNYNALKSRFNL